MKAENLKTLADAALAGDVQCTRALLDAGADVHDQNDLALCYAANRGHVEVLKWLSDHGADVHAGHDEPIQEAAASG